MFGMVLSHPEVVIFGSGLIFQWGYSMHRLKSLENAFAEMKDEIRELKR